MIEIVFVVVGVGVVIAVLALVAFELWDTRKSKTLLEVLRKTVETRDDALDALKRLGAHDELNALVEQVDETVRWHADRTGLKS